MAVTHQTTIDEVLASMAHRESFALDTLPHRLARLQHSAPCTAWGHSCELGQGLQLAASVAPLPHSVAEFGHMCCRLYLS